MAAFVQTIHASANGISLIEAADYAAMRNLLPAASSVDTSTYGFLNQSETSISFSDSTFTFTLTDAGSGWSYYRAGLKYTISGNKTVVIDTPTNPPDAGTYYIYIDATDGTLTASTNAWTHADTKVPVAIVVWNNALTPKYTLAEERHTVRIPRQVHAYLHSTIGTQFDEGGAISGYTVTGTTDAENTFAIAETKIWDEDIQTTCSALADGNGTDSVYHVAYRNGAGTWNWALSPVPFTYANASYIYYDNAGTMTDAGATNKFVNTYLLATNYAGAARFSVIHGQTLYSSLATAQAEKFSNLTLTGYAAAEAIAMWQLTWKTGAALTTKGKCQLAAAPVRITTSISVAASVPGLGTMATQNADNVLISGGAIDGTTIGGSTAAAGTFTTVTTSGKAGFRAAPASNVIYVPWVSGDAAPLIYAGGGNASNDQVGVKGESYSGYGVWGYSETSYGVVGQSVGSVGIGGISTNSYGCYGQSTNGAGVQGLSTNLYAGYFSRNTATPTGVVPVFVVLQDHASDPNAAARIRQDSAAAILELQAGTTNVCTVGASGEVSVISDTVGLKLGAAGGQTLYSNGTNFMFSGGDIDANGSTIFFGAAENTQTPTGATATINLGAENHHTLNLGSASGTVTLTLTVPPGPCAGTILIVQGATQRSITWSPTSGSAVWFGTEPTWGDAAEASKIRCVSWRWNATNLYLSATDKTA